MALVRDLEPLPAIPRHGGTGAPWIWNEDADPEAVKAWDDSRRTKKKPTKMGRFYTRTTTFVDAIDDKKMLYDWKARNTLLGIAKDDSIIQAVREVEDPDSSEGRQALNRLSERAQKTVDADMGAKQGDALHKITEDHHTKGDPGFVPPFLEPAFEAYLKLMEGFEVVECETFVVIDDYGVAGTFDRLMLTPDGKLVIGDLKSGRVDFGLAKMGRQVAGYSRGKRYCPFTFKRTPLEFNGMTVDQELGYIIHVPIEKKAGEQAQMIPMDLNAGWAEWPLCQQIREARKRKIVGDPIRVVQV